MNLDHSESHDADIPDRVVVLIDVLNVTVQVSVHQKLGSGFVFIMWARP